MRVRRNRIGAFLLSSVIIGLTGCHATSKQAQEDNPSIIETQSSAQTYALAGQRGYPGKERTNADGELVNPLVAPANQTYYFSFDQSAMKPEDMQAIAIQASYLANHKGAKIRLEGNADDRGSREYNIGLGWRRDQSVLQALEQQGVTPGQIEMVSYGKEHPAVLGNNEHAWSLNRRVHLVYEAY
ncbi:MAG: peptidoglycan-binding protein [Gammaproteobacteria bacterium RIFCSPHIGHO2_12_FULL_45_9]|nr:MAG: peptidoglycan-binding protein [Gammaproteobacteria bacterium RIFCSPHIGHO2_12_FULL_45_9]